MVEFRDRDELQIWFEGRSREVAVAIAVRAVLRTLPLLVKDRRFEMPRKLVLPCFRALNLAWFAGVRRTKAQGRPFVVPVTFPSAESAADSAYSSAAWTFGTASNVAHSAGSAADAAHSPTCFADAAEAAEEAARTVENEIVWQQISEDISRLQKGYPVQNLLNSPIWPGNVPLELHDSWRELSGRLVTPGENWQVWRNWYEDRLAGVAGRPFIEQLEMDRVLVPSTNDWEQGPAYVNVILAELERKYRAQVPAQRPAIIEAELGTDGRIHRVSSGPPDARDEAQRGRQQSAWRAHETLLQALETLDPGRNSPGLKRALVDYRQAMGVTFEAFDVIGVGNHGERLRQYAARADEILMPEPAAELSAFAANHALFMPQFPEWGAYLEEVHGDPAPQAIATTVAAARDIARDDDLIGDDVAEPLVALADAVDPGLGYADEDAPTELNKRELPRSLGNVIAAALRPLLDVARQAGGRIAKGVLDGLEEGSKRLVVRGMSVISTLSGPAIIEFAATNSVTFHWIIDVLAYLKTVFV